MEIAENYNLKKLNTFKIEAFAKFYASFNSIESLETLLCEKKILGEKKMILGGGSNVLFKNNFDGIVLKNNISGIELVSEDEQYVYLKAGGGIEWHQLVLHCINNNFGGMENMSLIPGSVGAGPIQNIGAYGTELKDVLHELEAFHLKEKYAKQFSLKDCEFGYRESIFKNKYKGEFVITSVTYRLRKNPEFNISYGAIAKELEKMNVKELSIKAISDAVCNIRRSKLPDPEKTGNAGSFFKNPVVSETTLENIKLNYSDVVSYVQTDGTIKLAAGWLIEKAGWKGYREGDAGVHKDQALVLVNYGNANGNEILMLSEKIIASVLEKFNVLLEREVNVV